MTNKIDDEFVAVALTRADIIASSEMTMRDSTDEATKEKILALTDEDMEAYARKLGNALMDGGDYWDFCYNIVLGLRNNK